MRKVTGRWSALFFTLASPSRLVALRLLAAIAAFTCPRRARSRPRGDEDLPAVQLSGAGVEMLKLALPQAEGDTGEARRTMSKDMDITGLFQLLDTASFPAQLQAEGLGFSSALWSQVGAQAVIKMKVSGGVLEGRVYIVARGDNAVLTKSYRAADVRDAVHAFANDVVKAFTGQPGVFGSRIALAITGHSAHEIAVVDMDGGRTSVVTKMGSDSLLPAFSPTGGEIAFTSYLRNNPDLYVVSAGGGRARRVSKQPGLNTGAAWAPNGRGLALTLSYEGNSEIYKIDPGDGRVEARLTNNPAIDSSPSLLARRLADRLRLEPTGLAADLRHVGLGRRRQAGHLPGEVQPDAALEPAHRQAADRLHRTRRARRVRRLHPRRQERQDRSPDAGEGVEPRPDLVARRATPGLRLEPGRPLRQQPRDPP